MGLFDKVRAAAEKAFADPLPPAEDAILPWDDSQPMAILVESEWLNDATGIDNQYYGHELVDRVRGGQLTRPEFERNAEQLLRMGHLLAADYERAVLIIDE